MLAAVLANATETIDVDQPDAEASGPTSDTQVLTCSCCHLEIGANAAFTELCAHCSWPLQLEWSDEAAYELEYCGWGGHCIACDNVQWPGTGCISCGAPVEPDDGAYTYQYGWHDAAELADAPAAASARSRRRWRSAPRRPRPLAPPTTTRERRRAGRCWPRGLLRALRRADGALTHLERGGVHCLCASSCDPVAAAARAEERAARTRRQGRGHTDVRRSAEG